MILSHCTALITSNFYPGDVAGSNGPELQYSSAKYSPEKKTNQQNAKNPSTNHQNGDKSEKGKEESGDDP